MAFARAINEIITIDIIVAAAIAAIRDVMSHKESQIIVSANKKVTTVVAMRPFAICDLLA